MAEQENNKVQNYLDPDANGNRPSVKNFEEGFEDGDPTKNAISAYMQSLQTVNRQTSQLNKYVGDTTGPQPFSSTRYRNTGEEKDAQGYPVEIYEKRMNTLNEEWRSGAAITIKNDGR